ncbi:hypothetical protein [Nocardiopsis alba]|uniref:VG15 protein n=1 Tax=Nocardiopsis alba TaxID=53437 RepID=UPI003D753212
MREFMREWSPDAAFSGASFTAWLSMMAPEIAAAYVLSAQTAERYYAALRAAEGVPGTAAHVHVPSPSPAVLVERLITQGPAYAAGLVESGLSEDEAEKLVMRQLVMAVTKEVLAGGRDGLAASMDADPRALGWQRVPSGKCCAFCAMLASRGPSYGSARSAGDGRRWHPGCRCSVEPVFSRRSALPAASKRYARVWDEVGTGDLNSFRRRLERPEVYARKRADGERADP